MPHLVCSDGYDEDALAAYLCDDDPDKRLAEHLRSGQCQACDKQLRDLRLQALARQAATGDDDAFSTLYDRLFKLIARTCSIFLNNHADVEEVAQDTFVRAHRRLGQYRGSTGGEFRAWLCVIAKRCCIDRLRRRPPPDNVQDNLPGGEANDAGDRAGNPLRHGCLPPSEPAPVHHAGIAEIPSGEI